jgi:hypothetical protein
MDFSQPRPPLHDAIIHKRYEEALSLLEEGSVDVNELDFVHNMAIVYLLRRLRHHKGFTNYIYEMEIYRKMFQYPIHLDKISESEKTVRYYIIETKLFQLYKILFDHHRWVCEDLSTAIRCENKEVFMLLFDEFQKRGISFDEENEDELKPLDVSVHCNDVFYCQQLAKLCDPHSLRLASFRAEMGQMNEYLSVLKQVMLKYNIQEVGHHKIVWQDQKKEEEEGEEGEEEGEEEEEEGEHTKEANAEPYQDLYQEKIEPSVIEWYE